MIKRQGLLLVALMSILTCAGCGGGLTLSGMPPEEQLSRAGDLLRRGKGTQALEAYRFIARDNPGTEWEEQARLGIARSYREAGDYFAAVQEYESFQRRFSRSPLVGDAVLEIAYCYLDQRAKPQYDQEWNPKAIRQIEEFLAGWPESPRVEEARKALFEARRHSAKKELENGITYLKLRRLKAARFYFELVIREYGDTPEAAEALYETARTFEMQKEKGEAASRYRKLIAEYPASEYVARAEEKLHRLDPPAETDE
jgi:outer membrane assembly lipoprotein YfiO